MLPYVTILFVWKTNSSPMRKNTKGTLQTYFPHCNTIRPIFSDSLGIEMYTCWVRFFVSKLCEIFIANSCLNVLTKMKRKIEFLIKTRTRLFLKTNLLLNNFWNRIFQVDLTVKATKNSINFMKGLCFWKWTFGIS